MELKQLYTDNECYIYTYLVFITYIAKVVRDIAILI